jgi:hypothetical protein
MRIRTILTALTLAALGGCAHGEHNYTGSPGSTYDAARNPPQARGVVTYDALKPIVPHDYGNGGVGTAAR